MNGLSSKGSGPKVEKEFAANSFERLVYLISPNKINQSFYASLDKVLSLKNVKFFQLRENVRSKKILLISKK